MSGHGRNNQFTVATSEITIGNLIVRPLGRAAERHPIVAGLWLVGLAILLFATGFQLTDKQRSEFGEALTRIDFVGLEESRMELEERHQVYYRSKGWFFRCDAACTANWKEYQGAVARHEALKRGVDEEYAQAQSKLGAFSEVAVEQARGLLYARASSGKEFAKRATFFDMLFAGINPMDRDGGIMGYILQVLLHLLVNIFFAIIGACTSFLWSVYWLLLSFKPSLLEASLFMAGAVAVVVAIFVSFGLGVYISGASVVLGVSTLTISNQQQRQNRQPRFIR